jgi:hypothetical protein
VTKVFKVDGVELPDGAVLMEGGRTNLPGGIAGLPTAAWYCEPGIGTINIDDPEGAYELAGWHTFTVDETECTGRERVWGGWLVGRRVSRGPYKDGAARIWSVDIIDINALFGFQVFRANSAQRPAETDVERMTWMIASAPMASTPVHDDGRFSTSGPTNLPAAEFVRSYPVDMATNAAGQSGKNVYAYWDHDDDEIGFHYDLQANGPACSLRASNVIADEDGVTTFYAFLDAELDADAYGTYTGVLLDYVGGAVFGENDTLIAELSPTEFSPVTFKRDQMLRSDRIGKLTTANAYLAVYLAQASQEREDITLSVRLPASLVNYIEAGMLIDVKLTHLPGLDDFTTLPIIRCSKIPTPNRTDTWDVRIQLSENVKATLSLGGDPGDLPHDEQTGDHWWSGSGDVENDIGGENVGGISPPFVEGTYNWSISIVEAARPDPTYASRGYILPTLSSPFADRVFQSPTTPAPGGDTTTFTGTFALDSAGNLTGDGHVVGDPTWTLGDQYYFFGSSAGPHAVHKQSAFSFWFDLVSDPDFETIPPAVGTWITEDLNPPDGTQTTFSTRWHFDPNSLQVWVDNTEQTSSIESTDPTAQTFTLLFIPTTTERIKVRYKVAPA